MARSFTHFSFDPTPYPTLTIDGNFYLKVVHFRITLLRIEQASHVREAAFSMNRDLVRDGKYNPADLQYFIDWKVGLICS